MLDIFGVLLGYIEKTPAVQPCERRLVFAACLLHAYRKSLRFMDDCSSEWMSCSDKE